MKIIASVTAAVALGLVAMLIPVMTYTRFFVATADVQEPDKGGTDLGQQSKDEGRDLVPKFAIETVREAAQAYGREDAGTAAFPSGLFPVVLLVAAAFATALGVALFFKRRVKLV